MDLRGPGEMRGDFARDSISWIDAGLAFDRCVSQIDLRVAIFVTSNAWTRNAD